MSPTHYKKEDVERLQADAKAYIMMRWEPRAGHDPPVITHGEGVYFWDVTGKKYLDLMSQLYNVHIGLGNKEIIEASKKQMDELAYASPSYFNVPQIQLAKKLAQITRGDLCKTFFGNSGAEANEVSMKVAQLYRGAPKIIGFWDAYHGSTAANVSIGGSARNRQFPGLVISEEFKHVPSPYCYHCPFKHTYPDCELMCADFVGYTIEKEGAKTVAAFMAEPICSWAGQVVPPDGYWQKIRKICDENNVLLIFDEVMTGFARTGKMFAYEHWNVVPDIVSLAKGITAGYVPLGACMVNKKLGDHFDVKGFPHSYTYSGHALACATSLAVINYYEKEKLVERTAEMGKYMMGELRAMQERQPVIGDVRGLGLFIGVELVANTKTKEDIIPKGLTPEEKLLPEKNPMTYLGDLAKDKGLIIGTSPGTGILRLMPSLIITKEEVEEGLKILEETIADTAKKFGLPKASN